MSGGRSPKVKGVRIEREYVNNAKAEGLDSERVPLSGADPNHPGDLYVEGLRCESKARKDGWKEIYRWIDGNDIVLLKADRKTPLVVMRWDDWMNMLKELKESHAGKDTPSQCGTGEGSPG